MTLLGLGVIGTSAKENELRLPLHPEHLGGLDADLRERITLEHGYGERFGYSDTDLAGLVAGLASREEILAGSDVVLLPKPQHADVARLREGTVLWGWPHCVQDPVLTQLAIDRRLTLIAFEVMNHWTRDGRVGLHVFHKNNELAGYCSVLHALQLTGRTGDYGRRLSAVVIGFGATARGAVTALNAHGIHDVCVLTSRGVAAVGSPIHSVRILQFDQDPDGAQLTPRDHRARPGPGRAVPGRARHRRQLHLPGHLGPADLPHLRRPGRLPSRQPGGGRVLRRGHGLRVGPADRLRRPDVPGRDRSTTTRSTTARRTSGSRRRGRTAWR